MAFLLHQLVSESAARDPDQEALVFKDQTMTYGELERESNRLASQLLALGVEAGARVGVYMNRSLSSIVSACGILKAGAAYVPIDPMSPGSRISYIVDRCAIRCLLTVRDRLPRIAEAFGEQSPLDSIVVMDGISPDLDAPGAVRLIDWYTAPSGSGGSAPSIKTIDSDIAYVLFTSGSTGAPKGVMISHLNALTFVNSACEFFGIVPGDRLSNICPLHFDMSVFDIFVALKAGASVVIIPETTAIFPVKLAELIVASRISVWNSVPSALTLLASIPTLESHDLSSLRLVLFAGEVFPLKYLRRLRAAIPGARFCNMYGQTEANSSTYYWVEGLPADAAGVLPIGKALPNFEVFALDQEGRQVQDLGQEGELYVRASSVALGYWGDPERTEANFVKNPLRPDSKERVYRTGDLVRLDAEGNYVFLGRLDHMIKSRGYRIEIGEIETVLRSHPQITHAVVVPIPDELIGNRIAAIVVSGGPRKLGTTEILEYCGARLPKYMVPERIEFRDSLPTTSSGKVDRKKVSVTG